VPWTAAEDAFEVVRAAKDYGLWIIAAEKTAASLSIVSMPVEFPALLVLGSEKAGINHQIANWADTLVTVPGATRKLGIVSAGAILLYELNRKLAE
jgi:tRNA G18 (ribose-2'-O)-methylase SpoU